MDGWRKTMSRLVWDKGAEATDAVLDTLNAEIARHRERPDEQVRSVEPVRAPRRALSSATTRGPSARMLGEKPPGLVPDEKLGRAFSLDH